MVEGWLVQESTFYVFEFLACLDPTLVPQFEYRVREDDRDNGEVPQRKGKYKIMS